jgi:hypothetical protein
VVGEGASQRLGAEAGAVVFDLDDGAGIAGVERGRGKRLSAHGRFVSDAAPDAQRPPNAPPDSSPSSDDEAPDKIAGAGRWRLAVVAAAVLVVVGLAVAAVWQAGRLAAWARGEADLWGEPRYRPPHAPSPAALAGIDLARVHAELLPAWVIAASRAAEPGGRAAADGALAAVRAAVAADPNLDALAAELGALVAADPVRNADRILYLSWAWNEYLEQQSLPWRLDGAVRLNGGGGGFFYAKTYHVLADLRAGVGGASVRARLLERADHTNVVELYLGRSSADAAVIVDRVRELALDRVWPLLAEEAVAVARAGAADRAFAPFVRAEVAAALPAVTYAVLRDTASDRGALSAAVDAIEARAACGSDLVVVLPSWKGLPAPDFDRLRRLAAASAGRRCPAVTSDEAESLIAASTRLSARTDLDPALGALVAFLARAVTVHEVRHAADALAAGPDVPPACPGCPPGVGDPEVRNELSAYLASFAALATGYSALFQACALAREEPDSAHGVAVTVALSVVAPSADCSAPPADLAPLAGAAERALFGRSASITLPADFPATLPLEAFSL